jgi:hypothetical protein
VTKKTPCSCRCFLRLQECGSIEDLYSLSVWEPKNVGADLRRPTFAQCGSRFPSGDPFRRAPAGDRKCGSQSCDRHPPSGDRFPQAKVWGADHGIAIPQAATSLVSTHRRSEIGSHSFQPPHFPAFTLLKTGRRTECGSHISWLPHRDPTIYVPRIFFLPQHC